MRNGFREKYFSFERFPSSWEIYTFFNWLLKWTGKLYISDNIQMRFFWMKKKHLKKYLHLSLFVFLFPNNRSFRRGANENGLFCFLSSFYKKQQNLQFIRATRQPTTSFASMSLRTWSGSSLHSRCGRTLSLMFLWRADYLCPRSS